MDLEDYANCYNEVAQKQVFSGWLETELSVDEVNASREDIKTAVCNNAFDNGYYKQDENLAREDAEYILGDIASCEIDKEGNFWRFKNAKGGLLLICIKY